MNRFEKVLMAYDCNSHMLSPSDKCKECPFGYGYEYEGDHKFWTCNYDKITDDMAKLINDTRYCLSTIMFIMNEYAKTDEEKHVLPFKTNEDMARYFYLMLNTIIQQQS